MNDSADDGHLNVEVGYGLRLCSTYLGELEKLMGMRWKVDFQVETCSIWLYKWFNMLGAFGSDELAKTNKFSKIGCVGTSVNSLELPTSACCRFCMGGQIVNLKDDMWCLISRENRSIIRCWIIIWMLWKLKASETRKIVKCCLHPATCYFSGFWWMHNFWSMNPIENTWEPLLIGLDD